MAGQDGADGRATVLLVDDEHGHLTMASKILGRHHRVVTANGGQAALDMLDTVAPDVALVDYRMPGPSGNEVLAEMAERVPRCLRFLVTGDSDRSTLQEAINRGRIYRFVSKPVTYPALIDDIRLALEHRAAREGALAAERLAVAGLTASIAAHDIRNGLQSLAVIPMYIKLGTAPDLKAAVEASEYAQTVMGACVEEILAVSKGQVPTLSKVEVDLAALIDRAVTYESSAVKDRTFARHLAAGLPKVPVSEAHIRRVVGNLVRNAVQATHAGGTITISLRSDGPSHICLDVADDGPGIPAEVQGRLFQPFSSTKGQAGTGFGLKMSRDVVEAHGGALTYKSEPQKGTQFTLRLPVAGQIPAR